MEPISSTNDSRGSEVFSSSLPKDGGFDPSSARDVNPHDFDMASAQFVNTSKTQDQRLDEGAHTIIMVGLTLALVVGILLGVRKVSKFYLAKKQFIDFKTRITIFSSVVWVLLWPLFYLTTTIQQQQTPEGFFTPWLVVPAIILGLNFLYKKIVQ